MTDNPSHALAINAPSFLCRCSRPFARVQRGALVIESQHGGTRHINRLTLRDLRELVAHLERIAASS